MSGQVLPFDGQADFTVSIIREAIDRLPKPIGFRDAISGIKTGRWAKEVCAIQAAYLEGFKNDTPVKLRSGEELTGEAARDYHGKESCSELKKQLPAILFSGTFSEREAKKLVKHSGLIAADLDHLGDRVAAIKEQVCSDPHVIAAFVSPSGSGLKLVCRCDPDRPHEEAYQALEHYILLHFGLEIDKKCKDVSRMCFVSYDPELFSADNCEVVPYPPKAEKQKTDFVLPPRTDGGALLPGEDFNLRGGPEIPKLMEEAGWKRYRDKYWTRPGKETGISASWGHFPNTLIVFSESGETGFPADRDGFDPFAIYAHLKCNGDFDQATRELGEMGYGDQTIRNEIKARKEKKSRQQQNLDRVAGASDAPKEPATPVVGLESRRVRYAAKPTEPVTRLFLNGKPVCTPANLTTIISRAKTGKTTALGAAVAAILGAHYDRHNLDTFKFTAPHTTEAVVLIDTEQAPYDAWTCHQRTMQRAGEPGDPDWLHHYALVGYGVAQLRTALEQIIAKAKEAHGGIFTIILDGVADFVTNVNDVTESNELVAYLQGLAVTHNTPIICVIHSNEGVKSGDDGRGHLGKQLTRKAESNLLLKKVGEITTITSDKQRKAPITEADGVAFTWSDEYQRHITCENPEVAKKKGGKTKMFTLSNFTSFFPRSAALAEPQRALWRKATDLTGIKEPTFRDLLAEAHGQNEVSRVEKGGIFHYYLNVPPTGH